VPTWALDLDGVVWLAGRPIPGSADAVTALRAAGERVVFLTNNSGPTLAGHIEALSKAGVQCPPDDLTTSAQAAASMLAPGSQAVVVGDAGLREALDGRGVNVVEATRSPDAVVVGRTVDLDYWALGRVAGLVRDGARFIATNTDATYPTPQGYEGDKHGAEAGNADGLLPGAGALVAFIATAAGRQPEVAGKPEAPMAALVRARYGALDVVAGDQADTDGLLAERVGAKFALVLSGVTRPSDLPVKPAPVMVGADLLALVQQFLGATPAR
jgi:HAD superfamily hydrolase (TIGR01450 family)